MNATNLAVFDHRCDDWDADQAPGGTGFGFIMQDEVIVRYQFSDEQMKQIATNPTYASLSRKDLS